MREAQIVVPTPEQFAQLGMGDIAYVRAMLGDGGTTIHVVCLADGRQVGAFADRDVAFAAVRQNALEPLSVH
jgi:hypothetical protein